MHEKSNVGIDHLTFVAQRSDDDESVLCGMIRFAELHFGPGNAGGHGGFHGYGEHVAFGDGVKLFYQEADADGRGGRPEVILELKGSAWSRLEPCEAFDLVAGLRAFSGRCTRIDCRFDDWDKVISPSDIWERYAEPRNYKGPRTRKIIKGGVEVDGSTVYFGRGGKSGGGRLIRIYDKGVESHGLIDAVRYEVEFSKVDDCAQDAFYHVSGAGSLDEYGKRVGSMVGGSIDFHEERDRDHAKRSIRAPWWETIRGWLRLD
jgi:DNA relaxase NicK